MSKMPDESTGFQFPAEWKVGEWKVGEGSQPCSYPREDQCTITNMRTQSNHASAYRLRIKDGKIYLQGRFDWWTSSTVGYDWRDIEPYIEPSEEGD